MRCYDGAVFAVCLPVCVFVHSCNLENYMADLHQIFVHVASECVMIC